MNPPPEKTSASRATPARIGALAACVCGALALALVEKRSPEPGAAIPVDAPSPSPALTPEQIFATIPPAADGSETAKALASMLGKVRKSPQDAAAWVNLGDTLAQALRDTADETYYDPAEAAYQEALRLNPRNVDAMAGMAWATGGRHDFDKSRDWASRALALDPANAAACGILGDAAVEQGDYDAAFEHYQRMMDLKPDLSSWSRGAHVLWLTGDVKKAQWLMEKAIKAGAPVAENTAWCRAKLAMMLFHEGALIPATQVLEPALNAVPKNIHVLVAAGRIAAAREDFPAAETYFKTVSEIAPNHDALVALGDLQAARGETAQAERYYAQVEALDAIHTARAGHSHLAMAKFYADHDRKLVQALRMASEHKLTRNVHEADILAWVYFKNGDQARALEASKRALSQNTPDAEIHFHAGMIEAKSGDRTIAQEHLRRALSLNPRFSLLHAPMAAETADKLARTGPAQAMMAPSQQP